ncbi:MAG: Hsp33 family molecular chaperone HslO [Pseudomonadota bacterium]
MGIPEAPTRSDERGPRKPPARCLSFATRDPRDRTRNRSRDCGRKRIDRVLKSIRREEFADLRDSRGLVAVKCEFCSTE